MMINTIKLYIYGGLTLAIGIFVFIFRLRGTKIDTLQTKLNENKDRYKNDIKVAKFETENEVKAEEAEREIKADNVGDGNYSL